MRVFRFGGQVVKARSSHGQLHRSCPPIALVLGFAVATFAGRGNVHAQGEATVVLPAAGGKGEPSKYVKRVDGSLKSASKRSGDTIKMASKTTQKLVGQEPAQCVVDVGCLAKAGAALKAKRVVGVLVSKKGGDHDMTLLLVDASAGRELARKTYRIKHRKLPRQPGARLEEFLAEQFLAAMTAPAPKPELAPEPEAPPAPEPAVEKAPPEVSDPEPVPAKSGNAPAEGATTVVLPPAAGRGEKSKYVKRVYSSLKSASKRSGGTIKMGSKKTPAQCTGDAGCLAETGSALGASRVVGVLVDKNKVDHNMTLLLVDVSTGRELARKTYLIKHRKLMGHPGARLEEFLAEQFLASMTEMMPKPETKPEVEVEVAVAKVPKKVPDWQPPRTKPKRPTKKPVVVTPTKRPGPIVDDPNKPVPAVPSGTGDSPDYEGPSWKRDAAWISIGITVASAMTGALLRQSVSSRQEDIQSLITARDAMDNPRPFDGQNRVRYEKLVDEGNKLSKSSKIAFGVAGAAAASSVLFFILNANNGGGAEAATSGRASARNKILPYVTAEGAIGFSAGWAF